MIGFGVLDILEEPGPPGLLLILAFILMYVLRPYLEKKAKGTRARRPRPRPPPDGNKS